MERGRFVVDRLHGKAVFIYGFIVWRVLYLDVAMYFIYFKYISSTTWDTFKEALSMNTS